MKQLSVRLCVMALAVSALSCGSSIESDARKVADLQCEARELAKKILSGDQSAAEEAQKLSAEALRLTSELQQKYSSVEDRQKLTQALIDAAANCK